MSQVTQDLQYAVRGLLKQPGFTLTAVLTLALGIGANTAIFSVVNSVLLTPPPFRSPERIVVAWAANPEAEAAFGFRDLPLTIASLFDWQRESRSFESLGLLQSDRMTMTGRGEPEQLGVVKVAGDFFGVMGTSAQIGRTLQPSDDTMGTPTVVVLSHNFWQRRFGGDPAIVNQRVVINGNPVTVIGVMPPRFTFPRGGSEVHASYSFAVDPDVWLPFPLSAEQRQDRGSRFSFVVGRLKPGIGMAAAESELKSIAERLSHQYPESDHGWSAFLVPIRDQMAGSLKPVLMVLFAAVGFVLLIACVNVANLLLARAASRQKEIALRTAIGAGRKRLINQLLTESALLSVLGGVLGIILAWICLRAFAAVVPPALAGTAAFHLDGRVLAFTALLCIVTTALAGLIPAFQMTRPDLASTLREGTRAGSGTMASRRTRSSLVVFEVAVAVLLLICAGLLLRSFVRLLSIDSGIREEQLLTFRLDLPSEGFTPAQRVEFFNRAAERLDQVPGVEAAGMISELPLTGAEQFIPVTFEGRPLPRQGEYWSVGMHSITYDYHKAMGIRLLKGRYFGAGDTKESARVSIIDEEMAKIYWPNEEPLGKRFRLGSSEQTPLMTVVGVVGSTRHSGLHTDLQPQIYLPVAQTPDVLNPYWVWMVARTSLDPHSVIAAARGAIHEIDRNQPVTKMLTMEEVIGESVAERRFSLLLLALFAVLALVLSMVGIYGITAYSVAQRTREMGLRMALGAQPAEVVRMVVKEAGLLAALGVVVGVVAALFLTRVDVMSSLLYSVRSTDPLTFVGVAVLLALVALIAAWLPGRRATRISPMVALRAD